jgi:hypothetical protein
MPAHLARDVAFRDRLAHIDLARMQGKADAPAPDDPPRPEIAMADDQCHQPRTAWTSYRDGARNGARWSQGMESNHRYTVLQTAALTTWLPWDARAFPLSLARHSFGTRRPGIRERQSRLPAGAANSSQDTPRPRALACPIGKDGCSKLPTR